MCHLTLLAGMPVESTTQNFDEPDGFFGRGRLAGGLCANRAFRYLEDWNDSFELFGYVRNFLLLLRSLVIFLSNPRLAPWALFFAASAENRSVGYTLGSNWVTRFRRIGSTVLVERGRIGSIF
jgi:hypothetical protein